MIKVLPKDVADKIAAGEVIESPVSIVKELVENSIDAGATEITCEIKKGGKEEIRITDNGIGIPKEQVSTAFLRHATSKISTAEDLNHLETLGFRGEALASIAAVSRTEMITKTDDAKTGTRIIIHGSNIVSEEAIGCPTGTTIIVKDLFYNVPARQKFLKSEAAEAGKIIDMMSRLAISKPDIKFTLISNGKTHFTTTGRNDLKQAILAVYKDREYSELVNTLYPFDAEEKSPIRVSGYVSRPSFTRTNRRSQFIFVNGRPIKDKSVEKGIDLGYKERLFEGRFPIVFLFIDIDPDKVDINVHPNKKEVRFKDEIAVVHAVSEAIRHSILSSEAVIKGTDTLVKTDNGIDGESLGLFGNSKLDANHKTKKSDNEEQVDIKKFLSSLSEAKKSQDSSNDIGKDLHYNNPTNIEDGISSDSFAEEESIYTKTVFGSPDIEEKALKPFVFDDLNFMGTVLGAYIIASDRDNFYLFDQHAAHERINYEKFIAEYHSETPSSQLIMTPFTFDVMGEMTEDDSIWTEILSKMGYSLEPFGDQTYIVREIPTFMTLSEAEDFVKAFVDSYNEDMIDDNQIVIDKLITKACKASIKANDYIKKEEIDALISDLKICKNPFSCPHGRPTFIKFSRYDIEKMFKRLG